MTFNELHNYLDMKNHEDFNIYYNYQHKYITIYFNEEFPIKNKRNKQTNR